MKKLLNTKHKNKPLKPPDITDPKFPYGKKNKHLHSVFGVRPETKKRKDVIQTPAQGFLEEVVNVMNAAREVVSNVTMPTTLVVYDFDHTLFKSPIPADPKNRNWWQNTDTLSSPIVPDEPSEEWWNKDVVSKLERDLTDPAKHVIVMTGRGHDFQSRVSSLLRMKGLDVPEVYTNYMGEDTSTLIFKIRNVKKVLAYYPTITRIEFYDDRKPHIRAFEKQFGEQYDVEANFISDGQNMGSLYEQKIDIDQEENSKSPLALSLYGAPASGKSFNTKQITKFATDPRIKRAGKQGKEIAIDELRKEFTNLSPRTQLILFFEAFFFFKDLSVAKPDIYKWWFDQAKITFTQNLDTALTNAGLDFKFDGENILLNGASEMKGISRVIRKLSDETILGMFDSFDAYHTYRIPVRYYSYIKISKGAGTRKDLVFDEVGGDAIRQLDNLRTLHRQKYVTDIIFFHAKNVAVNIIQTAYRIVTGDDGYGRDTGQNVINAHKELEDEKEMYKKNAEVNLNLSTKEIATSSELKDELAYANVQDDEMRGDKPIDVYATVDIGTPEEAYKRMKDNLKSQEMRDVFDAFLISQTYVLKMPAEAVSAIRNLVELDENQVYPILKAAIESNKYDYSIFAGLGGVKSKKGPELLAKLRKVYNISDEPVSQSQTQTKPESTSQLQGLAESKKHFKIKIVTESKKKLTEMPHIIYDEDPEIQAAFKVFDKVGAGVLDFHLELMPKEEYSKYSNGFEIEHDGKLYLVYNGEISAIEKPTGKPVLDSWKEYVNVRERDNEKYGSMVNKIKSIKIKVG